jgi:hypothetical protein
MGINIGLYIADIRYLMLNFSVCYRVIPVPDGTLISDIGLTNPTKLSQYRIIRYPIFILNIFIAFQTIHKNICKNIHTRFHSAIWTSFIHSLFIIAEPALVISIVMEVFSAVQAKIPAFLKRRSRQWGRGRQLLLKVHMHEIFIVCFLTFFCIFQSLIDTKRS